ncbi:MAG: RNA-binding protein [Saprospiraceae bacterium]|nr:RNA-binding protein [Saprospiraceae bacterium]
MKIYVGKLSPEIDDYDLLDLFSDYGKVKSAKVIIDRETNRSKCFGFVEMSTREAGLAAIKDLEGCEWDGYRIIISEAKPRAKREVSAY